MLADVSGFFLSKARGCVVSLYERDCVKVSARLGKDEQNSLVGNCCV